MWDSPAVEQYDEGISEDSRRVDIDGLEEAHCAALVQSARYLEGIRRYHDRNVKERSFNVGDDEDMTPMHTTMIGAWNGVEEVQQRFPSQEGGPR
jgi:hypothetical protein